MQDEVLSLLELSAREIVHQYKKQRPNETLDIALGNPHELQDDDVISKLDVHGQEYRCKAKDLHPYVNGLVRDVISDPSFYHGKSCMLFQTEDDYHRASFDWLDDEIDELCTLVATSLGFANVDNPREFLHEPSGGLSIRNYASDLVWYLLMQYMTDSLISIPCIHDVVKPDDESRPSRDQLLQTWVENVRAEWSSKSKPFQHLRNAFRLHDVQFVDYKLSKKQLRKATDKSDDFKKTVMFAYKLEETINAFHEVMHFESHMEEDEDSNWKVVSSFDGDIGELCKPPKIVLRMRETDSCDVTMDVFL